MHKSKGIISALEMEEQLQIAVSLPNDCHKWEIQEPETKQNHLNSLSHELLSFAL